MLVFKKDLNIATHLFWELDKLLNLLGLSFLIYKMWLIYAYVRLF